MPDTTDDIVEIPVAEPVAGDGGKPVIPVSEEKKMAEPIDLSPNVANVIMTRTVQSGAMIENNSIEINKLLTFDHLENKRMVSLQQSLGAREVQSKETPGGPANANK